MHDGTEIIKQRVFAVRLFSHFLQSNMNAGVSSRLDHLLLK